MHKSYAVRSFIRYVGSFKRPFYLTCAVFAIADILLSIIPWLIGQLLAALTSNHNGGSSVVLWTAALVISSVGHDTFWRSGEVLYLKLLNERSNRYDDILFRAIIHRNYAYFADKFSGKVGSYATTLGRDFRELLDNFCYNYIDLLIRLPVIAVIMFTVNLYTGLIFVGSLLAMYAVGRKLAIAAAQAERKATDERSNMDGYIVDTIANFVSVKAFGSTSRETKYIYNRRDKVISAAKASYWRDILFWGVMSLFVRWIIWPSTIILNVYLFVHHELSVAQITTFLSAIVLFAQFIWEIIWNISQLTIRLARTEEAYQYLFGKRDIPIHQLNEPELTHVPFTRQLELRNVNFAYPDKSDQLILKNISLTVRQGEKIGVVGHSGGGKTTLIKLLLGYYLLNEDMVYVDDVPTDNAKLAHSVGYVPQDTALFHRSIRDNIAYSKPGASMAEIVTAAKHAQAHEFIEQLPQGYDTLVGERGIKLSGGQRQRIAIARAILKDAPILLLDEATSSLDSHSEMLIQKALSELMKERTALVVAHRLSTIQKMDRIIVLDKGAIVESGTHQELLKAKGIYAELWEHQSGGFITE